MEMMVAAGEVIGLLGKDNVCSGIYCYHRISRSHIVLIHTMFFFQQIR